MRLNVSKHSVINEVKVLNVSFSAACMPRSRSHTSAKAQQSALIQSSLIKSAGSGLLFGPASDCARRSQPTRHT